MASFYALRGSEKIPSLATALGDMLLAWTYAEEAQVIAMASILKIDVNDCLRLYQKLPNFRSRTQMLYLLIELFPKYEPTRTAIAGLSKLSKTRNRYVHGGFIQHETNEKDVRSIDYAQHEKSKERSKPVKAADVTNHANAVRRRADELGQALDQVPARRRWLKTVFLGQKKPPGRRKAPQ